MLNISTFPVLTECFWLKRGLSIYVFTLYRVEFLTLRKINNSYFVEDTINKLCSFTRAMKAGILFFLIFAQLAEEKVV